MNLSASTASASPEVAPPPDTRLHGRWLRLLRMGWVVVTLTLIALNLIALPDSYGPYFTPSPQLLQDLHRLGLSPTLYSLVLMVEHASLQLGYLALGLLLFVRRSADRMALFCSFALVTFGNATPLFDYQSGSIVPSLATHAVLRLLALMLFLTGQASLILFLYVFPSGRFAPRWTRWVALVAALFWLAVVFRPTLFSNSSLAPFLSIFFVAIAAVAQVYRYWRISTPRERYQTKWAIFGLVLWVLLAVTVSLLQVLFEPPSLRNDPVLFRFNPIFTTALLLIPVFLTIAIWRGQLWDIDTLINKALVYGLLTVLLGTLYAGLILGLESVAELFSKTAGQNPVVLVVSTLAIAALVLPVRRRIQNFIDRRFYRKKYDSKQTLAAFSATVRNEVDLQRMRERLLAVVQETMQPAHVSLWLRPLEWRSAKEDQFLERPKERPDRLSKA
jgi:hypothetical protein